jgi:hypothetical protein
MRRDLFNEVEGISEDLFDNSNKGVDLCLRLRRQGYLITYTPYALLYYLGTATHPVKDNEAFHILARWHCDLPNDLYYSPNMILTGEDFSFDLSKPDSFYCVCSYDLSYETPDYSCEGKCIGQEFFMGHSHFCAIGVRLNRKFRGTAKLHLRESSGISRDILTIEAHAALILDNEYQIYSFDPLVDSYGKMFHFYIEFTNRLPDRHPDESRSLMTREATDLNDEQDQLTRGSLLFKAYCLWQYRYSGL